MRDIEAVATELQQGATLIINSHQEGKFDHCNGYVYKENGEKEEISVLKVFLRYISIIDEVRGDKFFKLSKDKETGLYISGIYRKEGIIEGKSCEETYMFDSLENLNNKLKKVKKIGGNYGK